MASLRDSVLAEKSQVESGERALQKAKSDWHSEKKAAQDRIDADFKDIAAERLKL